MRATTLMLSVIVHGSAIGAAVLIGAYPSPAEREAPRVEILTTIASAAVTESLADSLEPMLRVQPEASPAPAELPVDPVIPERELYCEVIDPDEPVSPPVWRGSLARIRPAVELPRPPVESIASMVEFDAPRPTPPTPASVRVAASPRADNRAPDYPEHERSLGREGSVVVTAKVDEYGVVIDVVLTQPSRYAGFNRAALAAVRTWRFVPGTMDGAAIVDEVDVPVIFRLEDVRR